MIDPEPQQPILAQLPHGVQSQEHTQHTPCATGTEAKVASVVTAVTYSATQSNGCAREIERGPEFRPVLRLIRLPPSPRPAPVGDRCPSPSDGHACAYQGLVNRTRRASAEEIAVGLHSRAARLD